MHDTEADAVAVPEEPGGCNPSKLCVDFPGRHEMASNAAVQLAAEYWTVMSRRANKIRPLEHRDAVVDDDGAGIADLRYIVPGLTRGLRLLQLFTRARPCLSASEIAGELSISRSAAYRLIYTLEKDGFIARDEQGQYRPTALILTLGFSNLCSRNIHEVVQPHLRHLSEKTGAASYLVFLSEIWAVYVARVAPTTDLVSNLLPGSRLPAHVTSAGRVLLANQTDEQLRGLVRTIQRSQEGAVSNTEALRRQALEDRMRGYVYHASLVNPGTTSCASIVRNASGEVEAAITLVGPDMLMNNVGGEPVVSKMVVAAAMRVSAELGLSTST